MSDTRQEAGKHAEAGSALRLCASSQLCTAVSVLFAKDCCFLTLFLFAALFVPYYHHVFLCASRKVWAHQQQCTSLQVSKGALSEGVLVVQLLQHGKSLLLHAAESEELLVMCCCGSVQQFV